MKDQDKTREQLIAENKELRRRVAATLISRDITDRKRTEEAIRRSEAKYRRLYESMRDAFVSVTMDGRIQEYNDAYRQMLGYEPEELAPLTFRDLTPGKWHAFQDEIIEKQVLVRGYSDIYEKEYRRKDGTVFPVELRTKLLRDDKGQPCGMWAIIRDITERKRAEEALQRAHDELERRVEERTAELTKANEELAIFRKFAEASGEGFGMSDFDGCIVYVNPTLCRLLGEERPEEVIGKSVATYYPAEYMQRRKNELVPTLLRGGYWHVEQMVLPRHGKPIQTLQSTFVIRNENGDPFRIAVVISDITERKQAEEALRQTLNQLQAVYDGVAEGLVITDVETKRFLRVNTSLCKMLGYREEELLAASLQDIHPPEEVPEDLRRFQAIAEGRASYQESRPVLRKDGSTFYADITGHPVVYNGRPCTLALFRDVTERKEAQEALERERRTLKHLLQSSDHERQLIAYEIHDGLAQQLAGAIMQFDTYAHQKDTEPRFAAKAFDAGTTMLRQGHFEARRLISGVRPPILDESGVVAAVAHLVNEERRKKGPTIEYASDVEFERLTPILENAIYRIVQEGLNNACKHSKSKKVRVELVQEGDRVRIGVQDRGIGFKPEDIGESHFGVAGIRERARLLGGTTVIDSEPGKGTRIVVELPLVLKE